MIPGNYRSLAKHLVKTVQAAGRVEMEIYHRDFKVKTKLDNSPVTLADTAAETIILKALSKIAPEIPVVAEEAASDGYLPETGARFFLVDPLDGTKEFIRKSDEFTVNIALIENGKPVFGIVYAPALKRIYIALGPGEAVSAFIDPDGQVAQFEDLSLKHLRTAAPQAGGLSVVASKSHMTQKTMKYIEQFQVRDFKSAGSSLKFCLLAENGADLYPRFGPTMEWDTAAGHAVLCAAGGEVLTQEGVPLAYGKRKDNFRNPSFIAWANKSQAER